MPKGKGWPKEPYRHGLSARKVRSANRDAILLPSRAVAPSVEVPLYRFSNHTLDMIEDNNWRSDGKEWIAELRLSNGNFILNDTQYSDHVDESDLNWDWDQGDHLFSVGYIHYHPPALFSRFSVQDYVLGNIVHGKRSNHRDSPFTYMGLVTDGRIKLVAFKPKAGRLRQFEKHLEHDRGPIVDRRVGQLLAEMRKSGELVELEPVRL